MKETCAVEPQVKPAKRMRGPDKKPRVRTTPSSREALQRALSKYGPRAVKVICDVMTDPEASISERLKAATEIANRAYGMPKREIEANVQVDINTEYLQALKEINARVIEIAATEVQDAEEIETN